MDESVITENAMDFLKLSVATGAPVSHLVFGITLQDWMYIASIVASLFYVLDKIPSYVRRIYGWFKRKSSNKCSSASLADGQPSD